MWTVTMLVVITIWTTWHICWCARLLSFICSHCHIHLSSWLFVHFCCPLWVAMLLMATWLLFLVWKRSRAGGVMVLTSTLSIVLIHHVLLLLVHCQLLCRRFQCGPCFSSEKMRGGCCSPEIMGTVMTTGIITIWMTWHVCWHARSLSWAVVLHPAGDVAMPCCCCC